MAQTVQIAKSTLDELLARLARLESMLAKLLERDRGQIEMVDKDTEKSIGESLRDLEHGRYEDIDPQDSDAMDRLAGLK